MRKRESPNNWSDTEVSVPGAFELDHLQPVKLNLSLNFSTILIFILGIPFLITPERVKWEKGNHPTIDQIQRFQCLGHSNWTICSLLSWFCHLIFPSSWSLYWGVQFFITPESGREEAAGDGNEKRDSPKIWWDTGVSDPGAFELDHLQPV